MKRGTNRILALNQEIASRPTKEQEIIQRLDDIPGVDRKAVEVIVAELGTGHEALWQFRPGGSSAATVRAAAFGNKHLKSALTEAGRADRTDTEQENLFGSAVSTDHRAAREQAGSAVMGIRSSLYVSHDLMDRGTLSGTGGRLSLMTATPTSQESAGTEVAEVLERLGYKGDREKAA